MSVTGQHRVKPFTAIDSSRLEAQMAVVEVNCSICEKLAPLAICKVDEHGRPVHEECLAGTLPLRQGLRPPKSIRWADGV